MLESERAKQDAVQKETREQLELFRRQQAVVDKSGRSEEPVTETKFIGSQTSPTRQWATSGKKRRRGAEKEFLKGVKVRKTSSSDARPGHHPQDREEENRREAVYQHALSERIEHVEKIEKFTAGRKDISLTQEQSKMQGVEMRRPSAASATTNQQAVLGLGAYGSDSD